MHFLFFTIDSNLYVFYFASNFAGHQLGHKSISLMEYASRIKFAIFAKACSYSIAETSKTSQISFLKRAGGEAAFLLDLSSH